jgi:hypothetical protein
MRRELLGIWVVVMAFLLSVGEPFGHSAAAADQNTPQASRCGPADLRGTYGFFRSGENPQGAVAAVGAALFDGDGRFSAAQTTSRVGTITQGGFSGTYEVFADCRGIWYDTSGSVIAYFVLLDGGNELFFLSVSPGNTITGHSKRIAPSSR